MNLQTKSFIKSALRTLARPLAQSRQTLSPNYWGLEYVCGQLQYGNTPLPQLASTLPSPTFLVLEERLVSNLQDFMAPSSGGKGVDVFYSYKTNPVPGVLKILHRYGAGAEVISEAEFKMALSLNLPPDRIIYNGPAKSDLSLEWAIEREILAINLNHWDEIDRVAAIARRLGKKARVGLRLSGGGWGAQFGFKTGCGEALRALKRLLSVSEFEVTAVHIHRGTPIETPSDLAQHLDEIFIFLLQAYRESRWLPKVLDVGGSLALPSSRLFSEMDKRLASMLKIVPKKPNIERVMHRNQYASLIRQQVENWFSGSGFEVPHIIIEPGRSLTGDAQLLLTRVLDVHADHDNDFAIMDAGCTFARIASDEYRTILPLRLGGTSSRTYRLVGPICHMGDILCRAWHGASLQRGDVLAVMDAGAYFISDASAFSFGRPGVFCLNREGRGSLIRRHERFEDMVSLDSF